MPTPLEIQTTELPTTLLFAFNGTFLLYLYEISNNTGSDVTYEIWDGAGHCITPPQPLANGKIETYKADRGRTMTSGMKWKASAAGVVGYAVGQIN